MIRTSECTAQSVLSCSIGEHQRFEVAMFQIDLEKTLDSVRCHVFRRVAMTYRLRGSNAGRCDNVPPNMYNCASRREVCKRIHAHSSTGEGYTLSLSVFSFYYDPLLLESCAICVCSLVSFSFCGTRIVSACHGVALFPVREHKVFPKLFN